MGSSPEKLAQLQQETAAAVKDMADSWQDLPKRDTRLRFTKSLGTRVWSSVVPARVVNEIPGHTRRTPSQRYDVLRGVVEDYKFGGWFPSRTIFSIVPLDDGTTTAIRVKYPGQDLEEKTATVLVDQNGNNALVDPNTHGEGSYTKEELKKIRRVAKRNTSLRSVFSRKKS